MSQVKWLTPVLPVTSGTEGRTLLESRVQGQPGKDREMLSQNK